jgi:hypothetical protein
VQGNDGGLGVCVMDEYTGIISTYHESKGGEDRSSIILHTTDRLIVLSHRVPCIGARQGAIAFSPHIQVVAMHK